MRITTITDKDREMARLLGEYLELGGPVPLTLLGSLRGWALRERRVAEAQNELNKARAHLDEAKDLALTARDELIEAIKEHQQ